MLLNRGINHDFPFNNVHKVTREVLKSEGEAQCFSNSPKGLFSNLLKDLSLPMISTNFNWKDI